MRAGATTLPRLAKAGELHHVVRNRRRFRRHDGTAMAAIESPCILVCSIDDRTGYCFGCGRTRAEIGAWIDMTPTQRREVMMQLQERLETVERRPRRETRRSRMAREREA